MKKRLATIFVLLFAVTLLAAGQARLGQPPLNPFDTDNAHIFRIRGGKIHDIEAMGFSLPLNSKNGWSEFVR